MRSCVVGLLLCATAVATADDDTPSITVRSERFVRDEEPLLRLDYEPSVASQSPGAAVDGDAIAIDLGRYVRVSGEGEWWQSSPPAPFFGPAVDDAARGWRAGGHLSVDLGLFRVGASVAYGHVDGRYQRGTYRVVGISAYRTFRLSRWMLAWIALGLGKQTWLGGDAPPGERNQTTATLSIGTTFR
jgi:hypothetical protein